MYAFEINPNTIVCIRRKVRRHLFLFDRNDQVCNWCNLEEEQAETDLLGNIELAKDNLKPKC